MKTKTFGILLFILVVIVAAGALVIYQKDDSSQALVMGMPMIAELHAGDIAAISIKTPTESIVLVNGSNGWIVETRFKYPADFSRVRGLVDTVRDAKVGRSFDSSEEIRHRLALFPPDDDAPAKKKYGTLMELKNDKGELLAKILVGDIRKQGDRGDVPDGQYVMLDEGQNVYLVDKIFTSFETDNSSWLAKNPLQVKAEDIQEISCKGLGNAGLKYVFKRPEKGEELKLSYPTSELKVDQTSLNRLSNALSSLQIEDVQRRTSVEGSAGRSEPGAPSKEAGSELSKDRIDRINFTLFDGVVYHVYPDMACSKTGPCMLKIDVGWGKSEQKNKEKKNDAALRADQENQRLGPWIFVVPKWGHDAFVTDLKKLVVQDKG